jgi:hypothetical protein
MSILNYGEVGLKFFVAKGPAKAVAIGSENANPFGPATAVPEGMD